MKNTLERAESTARQPETVRKSGGALSALKNSIAARFAALLAVLAPASATIGCGEGEETEEKIQQEPAEIPECMQPENLDAPAPCAEPTTYAWEGDRLIVNFFVPEYNELCKNPVEVGVLGNVWKTKGDGTTDLEPMKPLEGVTFVYDSDPLTQKDDPYFVDAQVPQADLSAFALETTDARGKKCVSNPVSTTTRPLQ